jgi:hypothetical protein
MKAIPDATPITLTEEERAVLEALKGSTKSQARMRDRARIVLLAAAGAATREIGRLIGCTTGTASKWRVRYARDRLAGLDETGALSQRALSLHPDQCLMLNQIEMWFSILGGKSLNGASFHSVEELMTTSIASSSTTTKAPDPSSG